MTWERRYPHPPSPPLLWPWRPYGVYVAVVIETEEEEEEEGRLFVAVILLAKASLHPLQGANYDL